MPPERLQYILLETQGGQIKCFAYTNTSWVSGCPKLKETITIGIAQNYENINLTMIHVVTIQLIFLHWSL